MWKDPIVEDCREAGNAYAAGFDYDLDAIFDDLESRERALGAEVVTFDAEEQVKTPDRVTSGEPALR